MSERLSVPVLEIIPDREEILRSSGVPAGVAVAPKAAALVDAALIRLGNLRAAKAVMAEVGVEEFDGIYHAAADNDDPTPLGRVYARAARLALFAVTLGEEISREIRRGFGHQDFAYAAMLDTTASLAVDRAVISLEERYKKRLNDRDLFVLSYSPGYCGWHISGQAPLFERLAPESIGIGLNDSFLMQPIKSVSGVLVAAKARDHLFANDFSFCHLCRTQSCLERQRRLRQAAAGE